MRAIRPKLATVIVLLALCGSRPAPADDTAAPPALPNAPQTPAKPEASAPAAPAILRPLTRTSLGSRSLAARPKSRTVSIIAARPQALAELPDAAL